MIARWLVVIFVAMSLVSACAKRPAMTAASAPAPTGGVSAPRTPTPAPTTPAPRAATPQPAEPAPATPAPRAATPQSAPPQPAPPPPAARPAPAEFTPAADLRDINFDFDKYNIRPGDAQTLDAHATWLKTNAGFLVLIEGHCDERGTDEYNLALGERRAKAAMNYLVSQGVAASRVSIVSYGKERPVCPGHDEACWTKNRRARFSTKR